MELAINEIKTQAKKLNKAFKTGTQLEVAFAKQLSLLNVTDVGDVKLKHCLTLIAWQLGFSNWHFAQEVLSGKYNIKNSIDMGSFSYPDSATGFINEWFTDYQQAKKAQLNKANLKYLLPYKKQFILVGEDYIKLFKIEQTLAPLWRIIDYDMVASYNSSEWDQLACSVIKHRSKVF